MMITCRKPCNIGGRRFAIGDTVPESCIDKARLKRLANMGLVAIINTPDTQTAAMPEVKQNKPAAVNTGRKRGAKA